MYGHREHHAPNTFPNWSFLHHSFQPLTRRNIDPQPQRYTTTAVRHLQRKAYRRGLIVGACGVAALVLVAAAVSFGIDFIRYY